jgi:nucleotide-binding universal stress UspA family protein
MEIQHEHRPRESRPSYPDAAQLNVLQDVRSLSLHEVANGVAPAQLRNIVCPVDVCDHDQHALQRALRLAAASDATVHAVYVYQTPFWFVQDLSAIMASEIDRVLTRELARSITENVRVQRHVVEGQPLEKILDTCQSVGGDLIVVQQAARMPRVPRWKATIPERLLGQSDIPVIAIQSA